LESLITRDGPFLLQDPPGEAAPPSLERFLALSPVATDFPCFKASWAKENGLIYKYKH
jgi:hypothetical protein